MNGFRLDLKRLRLTTGSGYWNYFFTPLLAAILTLVFIFRGTPEDALSTFIFFSTLYFFWIGLFASCKTVNGAIDSGEWAYWVLGTRRSVWSYLGAQTCYQAKILFWLTLFFTAILGGMICLGAGWWTDALVNPYVGPQTPTIEYPKLLALFLGDETSLTLKETGHVANGFVFGWFLFFHGLGLFLAGVSGIVCGIFFSVAFKKPSQSVVAAILLVMLSMIVSFTSLNATRGGDRQTNRLELSESSQPPPFLPILYAWQAWSKQGRTLWDIVCPEVRYPYKPAWHNNEEERPLVQAKGNDPEDSPWRRRFFGGAHLFAYLLPQRYFFNVAHTTIPRYGYLSRGDAWNGLAWGLDSSVRDKAEALAHSPCTQETLGKTCPCVYCLGLVPTTGRSFNPFRSLTEAERGVLGKAAAIINTATDDESDPLALNIDLAILDGAWSTLSRRAICWLDEVEPVRAKQQIADLFADSEAICFGEDFTRLSPDDQATLREAAAILRGHIRVTRAEERAILLGLWIRTAWWESVALLGVLLFWCLLIWGCAVTFRRKWIETLR